ncbi:hypothetical protein H8K35_02520 [Undibacterium sp. LX40W]|uniref:Uncharacterized protein n=1 Tax=Undibacterium nitidum TaxID=2762298 RepID=A0A923KNJ6_9BURK|nr:MULTISPECIES: hypothetical protein [Undibacterium]MBC3880743.1 hypothetical protein [Undibacterium nitidum]MBC3890522.1 hypothetical protein [Undibacterium sp. LX40W]
MKIKTVWVSTIALALAACQTTSTPQYPPNPNRPKPTAQDIAQVPDALVEDRCESSRNNLQYQACIAILYLRMPVLDQNRRDHFGEKYDRETWYACMQSGGDHRYFRNPDCDVYGLRRWDEKISKPYIDMPEIKWPKSTVLPPPSWGMSNYDYFRMLCEKEAGEVIYRTTENVEGVFQMRPTFYPTDREYSDRYVLEDPYSITRESLSVPWEAFLQPNLGEYNFLLIWSAAIKDKVLSAKKVNEQIDFTNLTSTYVLFYRDENAHPGKMYNTFDPTRKGAWTNVPYLVTAMLTNQINAKFGYTWRGIGDAKLREKGIAGGEQIVVDLRTGEVLAWRRSFMYSDLRSSEVSSWWMGAVHCNKEMTMPTAWFLKKVLKPINKK